MVSKIEIYREVLEIEPNSKVFFPLARQLAVAGRPAAPAAVLARGIGLHPDHLEAKFLLIEILTRLGRAGEADAVFADVGAMLARYPSVWLLWSREAAARSKDPALAMLFLANYFQNENLTWSDVMERGLQSLRQGAMRQAGPADIPPLADAAPVASLETAVSAPPSAAPAVIADTQALAPEADDAPSLRGAREVMELAEILEAPAPAQEKSRPRSGKSRETGVRTRTMAALLAEQGDTAAALDIYNELLATTAPGPERQELADLVAALSPAATAGQPETAPEAGDAPSASDLKPKSAAKLVSLLEALAGRLENRAGA